MDNRLENLCYLTRAEHCKLHKIGKKFSEEHKEKLRSSNKGKKRSEQTKQKIRSATKKKAVYCLQLDKVFESIRAAARELYLNPRTICGCCKGRLKSAGIFHFKYHFD